MSSLKRTAPNILANAIKEAIDNDLSLSVHKLSQKVAVNETTARIVFKDIYRQTIHEYRQQERIKKAIKLLTLRTESILEIAISCGFETEFGLMSAFKKSVGISPAAFRAQATSK